MKKIQDEPIIITKKEDIDNLKSYNRHQKIKFICTECGCEHIVEIRSFSDMLCNKCKHRKTYKSFDKEKIKSISDKSKKTKLDRYGDENYVNVEKTKSTCLEKYGSTCVLNSKPIKSKIIEKNLKKYGVEYYVNPEKIKETMNQRYGGYTWSSEVLREKCDNTLRKKYGKKLELIVEKVKSTKKDRYGDENYNNSKKSKNTCIEKYGSCSFHNRVIGKYTYDDIQFDSSWELYLWIYAEDNGIEIEREPVKFSYEYDGIEHFYFPDFLYDGKLIEIKGNHFIDNNTLINPYDYEQNGLYDAKYKCILENNVEIITDISFAKEYVDNKYTKHYVKLFRNNLKFPYVNEDFNDKSDMGLIQHFHKSIYNASVHNRKSPFEAWNDKNIIKKVALNRLKYIGKCRPSDILQGFNVTKIAPKVSVFNPKKAIEIINNFVTNDVIFDPFSGFSGRMIASFRTKKQYIGQDINEQHIIESKEICDYLGFDCELSVKDVLNDDERKLNNTTLFTCPPYSNKERWNSFDYNYTCDEWIDICLKKYICDEYIFVVDETTKYNKYIVDVIENKSHFGKNIEYVIKI